MRIAFILPGTESRLKPLNGHSIRYGNAACSGTDQSVIFVAEHLAKKGHEVVISLDNVDETGSVIENMSLLEATPNRTTFRSHLVDSSQAGSKLNIDSTNYTDLDQGTDVSISPKTVGQPEEEYIFTIENTNVSQFAGQGGVKTFVGKAVNLKAQSINTKAATTVTIQGKESGLVQTVTLGVKADATSTTDPLQKQEVVRKFKDEKIMNTYGGR